MSSLLSTQQPSCISVLGLLTRKICKLQLSSNRSSRTEGWEGCSAVNPLPFNYLSHDLRWWPQNLLLSICLIILQWTVIVYFRKDNNRVYSLMGCLQGFARNISWKYGLHMARTILCACRSRPSHAKVTSTRSPRRYSPWNPSAIFSWKFFQHNANSSILIQDTNLGFRKLYPDNHHWIVIRTRFTRQPHCDPFYSIHQPTTDLPDTLFSASTTRYWRDKHV